MGRTVRGSSVGTWMGKSAELGMSVCSSKLFLSVYVDEIKMAGKKQYMVFMWKKLMKNVDLDEPTSFLDQVYLERSQRERKPNEIIIDE